MDLEVQKNVKSGNKDNSDMIYHKLWTEWNYPSETNVSSTWLAVYCTQKPLVNGYRVKVII